MAMVRGMVLRMMMLIISFLLPLDFYFRREISILRKKSVLLSVVGALEYTSGAIATLLSVITLVLTGRPLTPVNVFMLLSFNNVVRLSISYFAAVGMLEIAEAYSSLNRIEHFLLLENLPIKGWCKTAEQSNTHTEFQEKAFTANTLFTDPETIVRLTNFYSARC